MINTGEIFQGRTSFNGVLGKTDVRHNGILTSADDFTGCQTIEKQFMYIVTFSGSLAIRSAHFLCSVELVSVPKWKLDSN